MTKAFDKIRQVQIELSRSCPMAGEHPKCPASLHRTEPRNLATVIVHGVLTDLGSADYSGEIMFSIYNEPLTDPRLFMFLKFAERLVPHASIYVITNGWNLDQVLLDELVEAGVKRIIVNGYVSERTRRLRKLNAPHMTLRTEKLDDRMKLYDQDFADLDKPCFALERNLCIWSTGEVGLCCRDWQRSVVFGNLHDFDLGAILEDPSRVGATASLRAGRRCDVSDVCRRCQRTWRSGE